MNLSPPANLDDFDNSDDPQLLRDSWEVTISNHINNRALDTRRFFHPLKPPAGATPIDLEPIAWSGFPRAIELFAGATEDPSKWPKAYRIAETPKPVYYVAVDGALELVTDRKRYPLGPKPFVNGVPQFGEDDVVFFERQQDEYLEWTVERNNSGGITRMIFTAEGPEYWRTLARDPKLLTSIYNDLLFGGGAAVSEADLFWQHDLALPAYRTDEQDRIFLDLDENGAPRFLRFEVKDSYNVWNRWNTTDGCVHLIQRNNSLGAEINLAADATYDRGADSLSGDAEKFMTCAAIGGIRRNSDPNIARDINQGVADGFAVAIADPVGLYISKFPTTGIIHNGVDVTQHLIAGVRGQIGGPRQKVVRFELRAPLDGSFTLDQCKFSGQDLTSGGPIARQTTIAIFAKGVPSERINLTRSCRFSDLCEHPNISGFKHYKEVADCVDLDWSNKLPFTTPDADPAGGGPLASAEATSPAANAVLVSTELNFPPPSRL